MKAKPTIYVFAGYSGAGKDTAASVLTNAVNVKFASPGKRALEAMYQLPVGFMDDRQARQQIAPFSGGRTYLQVLIDFWKHRDLVIGSELFGQQTKVEALRHLRAGSDIAITDMRNYNELGVLIALYNLGYEFVPVWIVGGHELESDIYQKPLFRKLCSSVCHRGITLVNDSSSPEKFKEKVVSHLHLSKEYAIM